MLPRELEVRRIEKQLVRELNNILNNIKDENTKDISVLQSKYDMQVQHALRAAIQKTYIIAGENVLSKKNRNNRGPVTEQLFSAAFVSPLNMHFLTQQDLGNIVTKAKEYVGVFWRRTASFLRASDILPSTVGFNGPAAINPNALVTSLGVDAVTDSYGDAVTDKMDQIGGGGRIKFVTAHDERVCPECSSIDGLEWDLSDPSIEEPPIHDNCRCRLEPVGQGYE